MNAKLIVIGGKATKGSIALKLPTVVGRSRDAGLKISHPMVSRRHAELHESDGLLMVRDLGSLNGTVIDGQRVKEAPLPPNAVFTIGPLTFRAEYEYEGDLSALPAAVPDENSVPAPPNEPWSESPESSAFDFLDDNADEETAMENEPAEISPMAETPAEDAPAEQEAAEQEPIAEQPVKEEAVAEQPVAEETIKEDIFEEEEEDLFGEEAVEDVSDEEDEKKSDDKKPAKDSSDDPFDDFLNELMG